MFESMDWIKFLEMAAIGTPLSNNLIRALVQYIKGFKDASGEQYFHGNALRIISLIIGVVFGAIFMFVTNRPDLADWYEGVVYGVMLLVYGLIQGMMASGVYDSEKSAK